MSKTLITSAAYCDLEMQAEMGKLPPSFLPVGNKRLYELQHALVKDCSDSIVLTLPASFEIPSHDQFILEKLGIEVVHLPEELSLGQAILHALNLYGIFEGPIRILHGDTLFSDLPETEPDTFSVGYTTDSYRWTTVLEDTGEELSLKSGTTVESTNSNKVLSGYFLFSDAAQLIRALVLKNNDFIQGLVAYHEQSPLRAVELPGWRDFGHVITYYQSRKTISTQRAFNNIHFSARVVEKTSSDMIKMQAESAWFENLPPEMRIYTPCYLGKKNGSEAGYKIESLNLLPLNDLYVFGKLEGVTWEKILSACATFLSDCQVHSDQTVPINGINDLYLPKTLSRLELFSQTTGFDLSKEILLNEQPLPSVEQMAERSATLIGACTPTDIGVVHGDLCFSNIFYDFRSGGIKLIDPRGYVTSGQATIYGDSRYDLAKLFHSVVGLYDHIVAGRFRYTQTETHSFHFTVMDDKYTSSIVETFRNYRFGRYQGDEDFLTAMAVHLFLSMLPLHADQPLRQKAFLANAARLYMKLPI